MKIILTTKQEAYINTKVSSGRYAGVSDVVRNALRALEQRDDDESPALEAAILEANTTNSSWRVGKGSLPRYCWSIQLTRDLFPVYLNRLERGTCHT